MAFRIDYKIVLAFVVTIFLFVVMIALAIHNNKRNLFLSESIERTNYMMKYLEEMNNHCQSFAASYRGYAISPSQNFKDKFESSRRSIDTTKVALFKIAKENPELQDSIFELVLHAESIVDFGKQVVEATNAEDKHQAVRLISEGIGDTHLEKSTAIIHELEEKGRFRLRWLESQQKENSEAAIKRNNAYAIVCVLLVITIFTLLQRDLNKRRELEEKLRSFNATLEAEVIRKTKEVGQVFERISDGYFELNADGIVTKVNPQGEVMLNRNRDDIVGKSYKELYAAEVELPVPYQFSSIMAAQANVFYEFHDKLTNKTFEFYAYPFKNGMAVFLRDVTEKKRSREELMKSNEKFKLLNEQLRNLTIYLQKIREDERAHMAREIHDELGQVLTGIKLDLSWIKNKSTDLTDELKTRLEAATELTTTAIKSVRKIATDLRPVVLDDFGLIAAIEWHAKQFMERTRISVVLNLPETDWNFSKDFSIIVFRICQEALTNVARHAHATEVQIAVVIDRGVLHMQIVDNGTGFTGESKSGSLGLIGMRERAESLGGTLEIKNLTDGGVMLELKLPFAS
jgi:signal transduction histidine kinase